MERTRRAPTIGLLALILLVAACGSDGEDQAELASTLDEPASTSSTDDPPSDSSSVSGSTSTPTPTTASAEGDDGAATSTNQSTTGSSTTTEPASTSTSISTSGREGPELVDVRPVPILSVRSLGSTTIELTVEGGVEPCFIIEQVEVVETADQVELSVNAGSEPGAICIQIIELHTTTVELADPLGDRAVVDGTTGKPLDIAS